MLLNYTTTVPAGKTVQDVSALLAKAGATRVATEYDDRGEPNGIAFVLPIPRALGPIEYRLPVDGDAVLAVLTRQRAEKRYLTREQANRVAWRITKDWVAAQLAIIETQMVTADQVFLPYMLVGPDTTAYQQWVRSDRPELGN
jgi:hypothetical protein